MDEDALAKAIQALTWEANYRKRYKGDASVSDSFLAIEPHIDTDFEEFFKQYHINTGSLLDIGTGTGEQAIYLAQMGFTVTATDVSATAVTNARELAASHHVAINFIEDDIISTRITGQFDIIADRGCYALLKNPDHRLAYLFSVKKLLKPGGWLLMKADKKTVETTEFDKEAEHLKMIFAHESFYKNLIGKRVNALFFAMKKT